MATSRRRCCERLKFCQNRIKQKALVAAASFLTSIKNPPSALKRSMKALAILGSTGSIGTQTLSVVREHPEAFRVVALTAKSNILLLKKQIEEFRPLLVAIEDESAAKKLDVSIPVITGAKGISEIARMAEADKVVNALVGSAGLLPTLAALQKGKTVALANKETLVAAGEVVMAQARKHHAPLIPIDSEHSAILQCLQGEDPASVEKITITCSGGPFRDWPIERMRTASVKDALRHPTWRMGDKITIDSATWMNKGFEVIEAHWLYGLPYDKIEVVIHPQSIIHSLVTFKDGSTMAQLGMPDMRVPIQYALSYPKRLSLSSPRADFTTLKDLTFSKPDIERFPCLRLAYDAGRAGGILPAVLNAANEIAVAAFLNGKIGYLDIARIIKDELSATKNIMHPSAEQILSIDSEVKARLTARMP